MFVGFLDSWFGFSLLINWKLYRDIILCLSSVFAFIVIPEMSFSFAALPFGSCLDFY